MFFITWQRVTIVRTGYKVSEFKNDLRKSRIRNQILLKRYSEEASLNDIHERAVKKYSMRLPMIKNCGRVVLKENVSGGEGTVTESVASFLKKIFGPGKAQAK
ncbi:MAG: hypothetical protein PF545_07430 [Elusimicrobia bacterium]|nr:hypothetical protein [Elusimicrobiota bacterium]